MYIGVYRQYGQNMNIELTLYSFLLSCVLISYFCVFVLPYVIFSATLYYYIDYCIAGFGVCKKSISLYLCTWHSNLKLEKVYTAVVIHACSETRPSSIVGYQNLNVLFNWFWMTISCDRSNVLYLQTSAVCSLTSYRRDTFHFSFLTFHFWQTHYSTLSLFIKRFMTLENTLGGILDLVIF